MVSCFVSLHWAVVLQLVRSIEDEDGELRVDESPGKLWFVAKRESQVKKVEMSF